VLVSVAVLFAETGSVVELLATAVLVRVPVVEAGTVYATVTTLLVPAVMVPREHLKLGPPETFEQVTPLGGAMVPRVYPAGQVSVTVTPLALLGPALATVMVKTWTVDAPAMTVVTPSVLVTERSAERETVFVSVAVLLVLFGSVDVLVTTTRLVWFPVVEAGTV
jgi:hypothetical protein